MWPAPQGSLEETAEGDLQGAGGLDLQGKSGKWVCGEGAAKGHVAGGGKGAVSQAVRLQGQFWSDSSLLPYLLSFLPRLLSITKGQNIHQALGTKCLQSGGADRHWTESCSESLAVITGRRNLGVDKKYQ